MTDQAVHTDDGNLRARVRGLVESAKFRNTIMTIIIFNAITLGLGTSDSIKADFGTELYVIDRTVLGIFIVEILLKFYAYRMSFFKSAWNLFDLAIVSVGLLPQTDGLSALRGLRVIRAMRLLSAFPQMRAVVQALMDALPGMGAVVIMLLIVFYVFGVMATIMYGDAFDEWFGTVGRSVYSLFQIMTLESWSMGIVRPVMKEFPQAWSFFVPFIIITAFSVLNLFIGLLVNTMQAAVEQETEAEFEKLRELVREETDTVDTNVQALVEEVRMLRAELRESRGRGSMSGSQKFIARNRAPRVQIEYDVELYGAQKKVQLPFVMGVLSDLSGKSEQPPVADRKFLEIDVDTFDERMKAMAPRAAFSVPNTLTGEGNLSVDLTFEKMRDFSPEAIAARVPALAPLLEARRQLSDLMAYMDGKSGAETLIETLLNQPEMLQALGAAGGADSADMDAALATLKANLPEAAPEPDRTDQTLAALAAQAPMEAPKGPSQDDILATIQPVAEEEDTGPDQDAILSGIEARSDAEPEGPDLDAVLKSVEPTPDTAEAGSSVDDVLAKLETPPAEAPSGPSVDDVLGTVEAHEDTAPSAPSVDDVLGTIEATPEDAEPDDGVETVLSSIQPVDTDAASGPDVDDVLSGIEAAAESQPAGSNTDDILAGLDAPADEPDAPNVDDVLGTVDALPEPEPGTDDVADALASLEAAPEVDKGPSVDDVLGTVEAAPDLPQEATSMDDVLASMEAAPEVQAEPDSGIDDILGNLDAPEDAPDEGAAVDDILSGLETVSEPQDEGDGLDDILAGIEPGKETDAEPEDLDQALSSLQAAAPAEEPGANSQIDDVLANLEPGPTDTQQTPSVEDVLGTVEAPENSAVDPAALEADAGGIAESSGARAGPASPAAGDLDEEPTNTPADQEAEKRAADAEMLAPQSAEREATVSDVHDLLDGTEVSPGPADAMDASAASESTPVPDMTSALEDGPADRPADAASEDAAPEIDDLDDLLADLEPAEDLDDLLGELDTGSDDPGTLGDAEGGTPDAASAEGTGISDDDTAGSLGDDLDALLADADPTMDGAAGEPLVESGEAAETTDLDALLDDLAAEPDTADAEDDLDALLGDVEDGSADAGRMDEAASEEDDLDALLAGMDASDPEETVAGPPEDDLDSLLAETDGAEAEAAMAPDTEATDSAGDDLDDLLADLGAVDVGTSAQADPADDLGALLEDLTTDGAQGGGQTSDDLDDLLADLDASDIGDVADVGDTATDDLDELLSDFGDGPETSEVVTAPEGGSTPVAAPAQNPFGTITAPQPERDAMNRSRFRMAIFGDFTGRAARGLMETGDALAARPPIQLDVDTVEDVIEGFATTVTLPIGKEGAGIEVSLKGLDDLHPDELYENVDIFESIAGLRQQLGVGSMAGRVTEQLKAWSAEFGTPIKLPKRSAGTSVPPDLKLSDFQALIGDTRGTLTKATPADDLIARIVGPHIVKAADAGAAEMLTAVDDALSAAMRLVLHHPDFQAVESQWRSLDLLARRIETDSSLEIVLYDISAEEMAADLSASEDLAQSGLFKLLTDVMDPEDGAGGFSALFGMYTFEETPPHAELLARIAQVAAHLDAPFFAGITPSYLETAKEDRHPLVAAAWDKLRALPQAAYLGLASPRFLLRQPYGAKSEPCYEFDFEEFTPQEGLSGMLWANPVVLVAILLAGTWKKDGKAMNLGSLMSLGEMPYYFVNDRHGDQVALPCTERNLTSAPVQTTLARGYMPVVWVKGRPEIRLGSFRSVGGEEIGGRWSGTPPPARPAPAAPSLSVELAADDGGTLSDADDDPLADLDSLLDTENSDGAIDTQSLDDLLAGFGDGDDGTESDGGDDEMDPELAALLEGL